MNVKAKEQFQGLHITGLIFHILVGKNKELVFILIFITVSGAYSQVPNCRRGSRGGGGGANKGGGWHFFKKP